MLLYFLNTLLMFVKKPVSSVDDRLIKGQIKFAIIETTKIEI